MLTPDEIEACVLGAQWVVGHADPALARAAQDLMAKVADTVPERLRPFVLEPASRARSAWNREPDRIDMVRTRAQIHEGKKITLNYRDEHGRDSERTIWPIAVGYHEAVRLLAAWCELRRISAVSAPTASSTRSITTRNIRSGATCCGRNGGGAWSGRRRRIPDGLLRRSLLEPSLWRSPIRARERKPCQACGACCAIRQNWPRFTTEDDAGARPDPGKIRQRETVGHALRRRPLLGAVRQGRRGDVVA